MVIANLYIEVFEEQAVESEPYKPKIWKGYVDDTFTILDRSNVDSFLHHVNIQQPTIRFTMETEKESKIAFLDTSFSREPDGRLATGVYRKPTYTDQYLVYDSHHPQPVKRDIVKCPNDRAKRLVTKPSVISEEKKHLPSVLVSNGHPSSFVQKLTWTREAALRIEPETEFKSTPVLPHIKGVSEPLHRCLQQEGIRADFKSDTSHLVRPKDTIDPAYQDGVVYRIPCECGEILHWRNRKIYAGKDQRAGQGYTTRLYPDLHRSEHAHIDRDSHWYTRRSRKLST